MFWFAFVWKASAAPLGIVVPAYFYPGSLWSSMNWAAGRVPVVAIMNPNSGPGTTRNSDYVAAVNGLRAAGGKVIGYVSTSYGKRLATDVQADIDRYFSFYTLDGIFLDEFTNDSNITNLNHYAGLYQYIRSKGTNLLVIGNPGTQTQEAYLTRPCADVLVTLESPTDYSNYVAIAWVTNHLARQFCHLPYAVPAATTMTNYVNLAVNRNVGWIYITSDSGANPWDTLPMYWTNEVNYIQGLNKSAPATYLNFIALSNGLPTVRIMGAPGVYELQSSSNLVEWSTAAIVNQSAAELDVTDSGARNSLNRLYRTRQ